MRHLLTSIHETFITNTLSQVAFQTSTTMPSTRAHQEDYNDSATAQRVDEDYEEQSERSTPENASKSSVGNSSGPAEGDRVSWKWGGGRPEGTVVEVNDSDTSIKSKNGNEVWLQLNFWVLVNAEHCLTTSDTS